MATETIDLTELPLSKKRDEMRLAVLDALDAWSQQYFLEPYGCKDSELPALFEALDKHFDCVVAREGKR